MIWEFLSALSDRNSVRRHARDNLGLEDGVSLGFRRAKIETDAARVRDCEMGR
jgi:hypothetical protein